MIPAPVHWKQRLITVLAQELTGVVDRFTIMADTPGLLDGIQPDLLKARDELTRILQTVQEK